MANFKLVRFFVLILISAFIFSSCIKDEAQNTEADIVSCTVDGNLLIRNPIITNNEVRLYVNGWDDITHIAPVFEITDGATIEPASGSVHDFSTPQTYTVTSQDGQWKKAYTVSFISDDIATNYHFENMKWYEYVDNWNPSAEPKKLFHVFYDTTIEGANMEWGSGNAGYMITNNSAPAESYPTSQSEDGFVGKCVKLTTVSTGALGVGFGAPLAAGNLFLGTFEINLLNMAKSTHFGQPFRKMPQALVGYYKYKAGEKYTDKNNTVVPEKKDEFDIYAVFYEVTADVPYLDGTNSLTSDNIILLARLTDKKETDEWTRFNIPFEAVNGRKIDAQKLKDGKYNLAIIMSSSKDGANFNGAVGSTLYVDEMELFYE